jgi:recombination protein RecA
VAVCSASRDAVLDQLVLSAEQRWGYKALVRLSASPTASDIPVISTGFPDFDSSLGIGGIPRGRITQLFGSPSSGKATLAVKLLAMSQVNNGLAVYIDLGRSFDPVYAAGLGVDLDRLLVVRPDNMAAALKITVSLVCSKEPDLIVFDSANFAVERPKNVPENVIRSRSWLMSKALRSLAGLVDKSNMALIFVDEIPAGNVSKEDQSDLAMRFYSSIRVSVSRGNWLFTGADVVGWTAKTLVVKNKLAAPLGTANLRIVYENRLYAA